ncbi:MAG: glucans biosynthesis glucosyltransferase MdoH [Hyphomicrobiaceae bacterium]
MTAIAGSSDNREKRLDGHVLARRRRIVVALNSITIAVLAATMAYLLAQSGWTMIKGAMWLAYLVTLPWLSIGFWNALIGFGVLKFSAKPLASIAPMLATDATQPITARTAIVMAIRNEDPAASIDRLRVMFADIDRAGLLDKFDFHVLSDTDDSQIAAREKRLFHLWQIEAGARGKIHYRRRTRNDGYKAGNIDEFCERCGDAYEFFLPLDADSFMSAKAIIRLVRAMQANPEIGILQGLVVGAPSKSFFTRTFQFGMRHGMRAYTVGSAWWQSDCGPYWGHNAVIRMDAFRKYCKLPVLEGTGPLSGHILSHDQVEAVLMRRAGYEVRVLPAEDESWEENPPSLPDFIRREIRWCQGNMQYWQLLTMPDTPLLGRVQLALAILMYVSPVAWMIFILLGAVQVALPGTFFEYSNHVGLVLFATIIAMSMMPKLMGLASTLFQPRERRRYGGTVRILLGGLVETIFSALAAPVVGFAITVFAVGLLFGRKIDWRAQQREVHTVRWSEAARTFWPQTLTGLVLTIVLWLNAPYILPWASPVLAGFILSIPFTVFTSNGWAGRASCMTGLCNIPEDRRPPLPLRRLVGDAEKSPEPPAIGGIKQAS